MNRYLKYNDHDRQDAKISMSVHCTNSFESNGSIFRFSFVKYEEDFQIKLAKVGSINSTILPR